MKIEDINITNLVHALAGLTLAATIALFGYEVTKPAVTLAAPLSAIPKISPLSEPAEVRAQLHRLPELAPKYQRKVLVYGWKRKPWNAGKNYTIAAAPGKYDMVALTRVGGED